VGTEETLAWEARQRPRAALACVLAAVLVIGSYIGSGLAFSDAPRSSLGSALERAAQEGPIATQPSLKVPFYEFYSDRAAALIGSSIARAIGFLLIGLALTFLAFAARARSESYSKPALYSPIIGGVLSAISYVVSPVGTIMAVESFLDGPKTVEAAQDVVGSSLVVAAGLIGFVGGLALALGFILTCLRAMQVGLLTRFMGVLGILAGTLTLIPIASPFPVVQCFWLVALGVLFAGRWPGGTPPAWATGRAEPWPTQQQVREAREAGKTQSNGRGRSSRAADPVPVAARAASDPDRPAHPVSKKKKRKRRA
jgi:hypothetical protein